MALEKVTVAGSESVIDHAFGKIRAVIADCDLVGQEIAAEDRER